jgi:hypothetical protein
MNSAPRIGFILFLFILTKFTFAQTKDSIYLMNGNVIGETVIDSSLGAVTIMDPKKPTKRLHYEYDQLYKVNYAKGFTHWYYSQDSTRNNWFTREEMGLFIIGERDSRNYFKPRACAVGAALFGFIGGASGTFYGPILPYSFMAFSGITKIKIRHSTVSDPKLLDYDAYILGYERNARQKRKIWSVISGSIGLAAGYIFYFALKDHYPTDYKNGKFIYK